MKLQISFFIGVSFFLYQTPVFAQKVDSTTDTTVVLEKIPAPSASPATDSAKKIIITPDPAQCKPEPCVVYSLPVGTKEYSTDPIKVEKKIEAPKIEPRIKVLTPEEVEIKLTTKYGNTAKSSISPLATPNCKKIQEAVVCDAQATLTYEAKVEVKKKILQIIPVTTKKEVTLNAITGEIVSETKESSWYQSVINFFFE